MQETFMRSHVRLLFSLCIALVLVSILSPVRVSAQTKYADDASATQPTLQLAVGFGDNSRLDFWVPALITVSNGGAAFTGVLSVTTFTSRNPCEPSASG